MSNSENNKKEESLAERSARMEAEAQAMYDAQASADPLAPEPVSEDGEYEDYEDGNEHEASGETVSSERITQMEAKMADMQDKMMRVVADAENTKRRALKERDDAKKFAVSSYSRDLLPVADNLRRALDAIPDDLKQNDQINNLIEGIEATERELLRTFEKNGLVKIDPIDQIFDPNFHEVMFEAPMPGKAPGTIIQVMETGYLLHDRLIRPARVGVAKDDGQGTGGGAPPTDPGHNIDTEA